MKPRDVSGPRAVQGQMERDKQADLWKLADAFFTNLYRERHCEYGGWGLDHKRPFGNSDVHGDILEIIDYPPIAGDYYSEAQEDYAAELYDELGGFLREQWVEFRSAPSDPNGNDSSNATGVSSNE